MALKQGTQGNNILHGTAAADQMFGYGGNDNLLAYEGDDQLWGGAGNDSLSGGTGDDYFHGGSGFDSIWFYEPGDIIVNLDPAWPNVNKAIQVGAGTDTLISVEGFYFNAGDDTFIGNSQANFVVATGGEDGLYGNGGDDQLFGGAHDDTIAGGDGLDTLHGDDGEDTIYGGDGNDFLYGGDDADDLHGGDGADTIAGGSGADKIHGDRGLDTLTGNGGADDFVFDDGDSGVGAGDRDVITDFVTGTDDLDLSSFGNLDFIGQDTFDAPDQVRFIHSGGNTIVRINTVGNTGAEMEIELSGVINLNAGDFIL